MNVTYIDIIIISISVLVCLYYYGFRHFGYFKDKDIKYIEPPFPYLGSLGNVIIQQEHFTDFIKRAYNSFSGERYIGLFEGTNPVIFIKDLNLIRQTVSEDFNHFANHRHAVSPKYDPIIGNTLLSLEGKKWRDMRSTLSPAFSSFKMRNMFCFIEECAKEVAEFYVHKIIKSGTIVHEIDVKDTISRYNADVIANSAYGIRIYSFKDINNQIYKLGKIASTFSGEQVFKYIGFILFPEIMKILNITLIDQVASNFFREIVKSIIKHRENYKIVRNDMINLLMQAKKGSLKHKDGSSDFITGFSTAKESNFGKQIVERKWSDDEITAQALLFFIAGFETTSTLITFFIYEMVRNPMIQKTLQKEIDNFSKTSGGKINYDDLSALNYLDKCISETLRIWPPVVATDRICSKAYTLPSPSDSVKKQYKMNVGDSIWIPIYAIHHDPKYYPEPGRFDPERFSNTSSFEPMTYLPFGTGPRNCLGSRFALMTAKLIIFHLLMKFDLIPTSKTKIPVILEKKSLSLLAKDGIHVGLKLRTKF